MAVSSSKVPAGALVPSSGAWIARSSPIASARGLGPIPAFKGLKVTCLFHEIALAGTNAFGCSMPARVGAKRAGNRKNFASAITALTSVPVVTFDGAESGVAEINLKTALPETAGAVVHRGVITELQNRRRGTASTLTRAEVRGGGRKPYKQKGTGNARRGSQRTPLRPGGGVVFGPKPVDWSIKINKKEKRLAISTAIQSAATDALVVQDLETNFVAPKTKDFVSALKRWGVNTDKASLIFATEVSEGLQLSARNIKTVKILTPRSLNLYDVLRAEKVLFTESGLKYLNDTYGAGSGEFGSAEDLGDADEKTIDV